MKIKNFSLPLFALAGVVAMACMPAQAEKPPTPQVSCTGSGITNHGAYDGQCQGPMPGNIAPSVVANFDGDLDFDYFGASHGNDGPFVETPHGQATGTLKLAQPLFGQFVLGIKAGDSYSLYLFDGGTAGVRAIDFDTLGVSGGNGDKLSQAFVFTPGGDLPAGPVDTVVAEPAAQPVPEPGTAALVLAALAAVGLTARRRRR